MADREEKKRERVWKIRLLPRRLAGILGRFRPKKQEQAEQQRLEEIKLARTLLSDSKINLLRAIKEHKPASIYELAKTLKRDIKSVRNDLKSLSKIGFVKFEYSQFKGTLKKAKPVLNMNKLVISIEV